MTVHLFSGLRLSDSKLAITEKRMAVKYKAKVLLPKSKTSSFKLQGVHIVLVQTFKNNGDLRLPGIDSKRSAASMVN